MRQAHGFLSTIIASTWFSINRVPMAEISQLAEDLEPWSIIKSNMLFTSTIDMCSSQIIIIMYLLVIVTHRFADSWICSKIKCSQKLRVIQYWAWMFRVESFKRNVRLLLNLLLRPYIPNHCYLDAAGVGVWDPVIRWWIKEQQTTIWHKNFGTL